MSWSQKSRDIEFPQYRRTGSVRIELIALEVLTNSYIVMSRKKGDRWNAMPNTEIVKVVIGKKYSPESTTRIIRFHGLTSSCLLQGQSDSHVNLLRKT
jgi:hypothetical protein